MGYGRGLITQFNLEVRKVYKLFIYKTGSK